jgi:hypothetical protein
MSSQPKKSSSTYGIGYQDGELAFIGMPLRDLMALGTMTTMMTRP